MMGKISELASKRISRGGFCFWQHVYRVLVKQIEVVERAFHDIGLGSAKQTPLSSLGLVPGDTPPRFKPDPTIFGRCLRVSWRPIKKATTAIDRGYKDGGVNNLKFAPKFTIFLDQNHCLIVIPNSSL